MGHSCAKFRWHMRTPSRVKFDWNLYRRGQIFGHRPQSMDSFMCQLILFQQAFRVLMVMFLVDGANGRSSARCFADRARPIVIIIWVASITRFTPDRALRVIFVHRIVCSTLDRNTSRWDRIVINGHRFCMISSFLVRLVSQRHELGSIHWALFSSPKRWRSVNTRLV